MLRCILLSTLEDLDKIDEPCAWLTVYVLTSTKIVPRVFQLRLLRLSSSTRGVIPSSLQTRDAGRRMSYKGALSLNSDVAPSKHDLTISPLKRLQTTWQSKANT